MHVGGRRCPDRRAAAHQPQPQTGSFTPCVLDAATPVGQWLCASITAKKVYHGSRDMLLKCKSGVKTSSRNLNAASVGRQEALRMTMGRGFIP
jgi:hypothetical protein